MNKLIYDIGATNIKFALMSEDGEILARKKMPTPRTSLEEYLNAFTTLASGYEGQYDGIGVSTNGRMEKDGNTYRAYTMSFLNGINIKEELVKRFSVPVAVENDGYAAAIGEWWKGAGRGCNTVLGIVLGSAMGGGLIVDGKPWRGAKRNGAMIFAQLTGSVPAKEKYTLSAIETSFTFFLVIAAKLKFMPTEKMTGEKFFELLAAGDRIIKAMFKRYCNAVAVTVYNNALLLDPDKVIITGGLAERQVLIDGIQAALKKIAKKCLVVKGIDLSEKAADLIDVRDLQVECVKGELCLDANLYGALYCLLHEQ